MVNQKYPTYPKRRKIEQCKYSVIRESKKNVFFYLLLLLALKVEKAYLQSVNKADENISKHSIIVETSSQTTRSIYPIIKEYATKMTPFATIRKPLATLQKSVTNIDNLELAQIESSDHDGMIHIKALDMDKSGDSIIGSQIKNTKRVPDPGSGSKNKKTKKDGPDFNDQTTPAKVKSITSTSSRKGDEETHSLDNYFEKRSSILKISNNSLEIPSDDSGELNEHRCVTDKADKGSTPIPDEEFREAEKMTECIPKDFKNGGIVCVCNKTYCDKMLPIRLLPPGKFSWYRSSNDGYRFHKNDGQLFKIDPRSSYKASGTHSISTEHKLQKVIGCGGAFSDSASRNIESLSKQTRNHLMQSYYGQFGIQYVLGRVPIGGTDFSPRFYTYMDIPNKFMLSEQDLKYKIPAIREAIEITHNEIKLLGCSWTAPRWMKTKCSNHEGELEREYYQLYADYHTMFLDDYAKHGIKFWALSSGNKPMIPYNVTEPHFMNAMEWSPYRQSKWVNLFLAPTLNSSGYHHVKLIIGEENREIIRYYAKWFFEPLMFEHYEDKQGFLANDAYNDVSGISVHGYADSPANELFLTTLNNLYTDKFILLGETACYGKPQLGAWNCAERYAQQMMNYFRNFASGFIDWNLALDEEGGPNYLNNFLDAAIIVNTEKDEFYKQPMYYVIGHFSKFITPDSYMIPLDPFNNTKTGISAIAAKRSDDGIVVVAYNRSPKVQTTVFIINDEYAFALNISAKSINSAIFWLPT